MTAQRLARGRGGSGTVHHPNQLTLPPGPHQKRQEKREHEPTYLTILKMRRFGYSVRRAGRHHLLNGLRLTTRQLRQLARGL